MSKTPKNLLILALSLVIVITTVIGVPFVANAQYYPYDGYYDSYYGSSYDPYYSTYSNPYSSYSYPYSYNSYIPTVYGQTYPSYSNYYNPYYTQPSYSYTYPSYQYPSYNQYYSVPLSSVSCSPHTTSVEVGTAVTWTAIVNGYAQNYSSSYYWNSPFNFVWSGDNVMQQNSGRMTVLYTTPGLKSATVTVYSGSQSMTKQCGTVNVTPKYNQYPYPYPHYPW